MNRIAGVLVLLVGLYAALYATRPSALDSSNLIDVGNRQGFYGIMAIGVGVVMIAGGIDLSIGAVVALAATSFGVLLKNGVHPYSAFVITLMGGTSIGFLHGILVTKLRLQAFLITLCGLFVYRGLARLLTNDLQVGMNAILREKPSFVPSVDWLRFYLTGHEADGKLAFPAMLVLLGVIAVVVGLILQKTSYGRYWYAVGYSEQAARYAGVNVDRQRIVTFMIGSTLAALAGILLLLKDSSVKPDNAGMAYELEAITGAVLGGVSLRGGSGTALGIVLGAAVLPLLKNLINFLEIPSALEPVVIGTTLLLGTTVDELLRKRSSARKSG